MSPFQIVLIIVLVASCTYTVVGFSKHYGALSPRSRLFRTVGLLLLDLLVGLALVFTLVDLQNGVPPQIGKLRVFLYFASCLFLALGLMCIALLDALESLSTFRREKRQSVEEFVREEMARAQERKAQSIATHHRNGVE